MIKIYFIEKLNKNLGSVESGLTEFPREREREGKGASHVVH